MLVSVTEQGELSSLLQRAVSLRSASAYASAAGPKGTCQYHSCSCRSCAATSARLPVQRITLRSRRLPPRRSVRQM
eukprot:1256437-Pleurochrysis_carterae.AAC.1